jgi:4-aminobutyrate aminotransferase-like enzyme
MREGTQVIEGSWLSTIMGLSCGLRISDGKGEWAIAWAKGNVFLDFYATQVSVYVK